MAMSYRIVGGDISGTEIPDGGLVVYRRPGFELAALPGEPDEDWDCYTIEKVAEIVSTVAPWATVFCSPESRDDEVIKPQIKGLAWGNRDLIWLRSTQHQGFAITNAYHEAYHCAEKWSSAEEISALRKASESGPIMPRPSDYNEYWFSGTEVRARGFAAFAYANWLMGATPKYRWRMPTHERIWTMIYRGDLGLRAARRGHIPAAHMTPILRQRMAERGDCEKLYDITRRLVIGGWKIAMAVLDAMADVIIRDHSKA